MGHADRVFKKEIEEKGLRKKDEDEDKEEDEAVEAGNYASHAGEGSTDHDKGKDKAQEPAKGPIIPQQADVEEAVESSEPSCIVS